MSGQSGAAKEERYYLAEYTSGMSVSVEAPPWETDPASYVSRHFKETSRPYEALLEEAVPELNEYFERLAESAEFPIAEYGGKREWVYGVVIEDTGERDKNEEKHGRNWLKNSNRAAYVKTIVELNTQEHGLVELTFAVDSQILRSQIDRIEKEVAEIFLKAAERIESTGDNEIEL